MTGWKGPRRSSSSERLMSICQRFRIASGQARAITRDRTLLRRMTYRHETLSHYHHRKKLFERSVFLTPTAMLFATGPSAYAITHAVSLSTLLHRRLTSATCTAFRAPSSMSPREGLQSDHPAELFAQAQVAKIINKDTMILRIICGEGEFFIFRDDERDFDNVHGTIITTGAVDISVLNGE